MSWNLEFDPRAGRNSRIGRKQATNEILTPFKVHTLNAQRLGLFPDACMENHFNMASVEQTTSLRLEVLLSDRAPSFAKFLDGEPTDKKKDSSDGESASGSVGGRDLNSGPHGPEPLSEFSNCRPHGFVIFHSLEGQDELK